MRSPACGEIQFVQGKPFPCKWEYVWVKPSGIQILTSWIGRRRASSRGSSLASAADDLYKVLCILEGVDGGGKDVASQRCTSLILSFLRGSEAKARPEIRSEHGRQTGARKCERHRAPPRPAAIPSTYIYVVYIYIYIYVYTHICIYIYICISYAYTICICIYIYIYIYTHAYVYVYITWYTCVYIYIYIIYVGPRCLIRANSLLRLSLLRFRDSNFPGNPLWTCNSTP